MVITVQIIPLDKLPFTVGQTAFYAGGVIYAARFVESGTSPVALPAGTFLWLCIESTSYVDMQQYSLHLKRGSCGLRYHLS